MSQVSLPVRILLIGAVVFLAAWFTVLRPKPATIAPSTTTTTAMSTPQTGLGRAVADAKKAAGVSTPAPVAASTAAPVATAQPAAPEAKPVAIPAAALAKFPKDVAAALQARKTIVLGVIGDGAKPWRPLSDDDRYVRGSLSKVNRYDGQVLVKLVPVAQLSTYAPLVGDLDVSQTPSVVVIGGDLKGTVLAGFVDRVAVNQAIQDARRASISPAISDPYLKQANSICAKSDVTFDRWSMPTVRGKKAWLKSFRRLEANIVSYRAAVVNTPAPAKWRSLKVAWVAELTREAKLGRDLEGSVRTMNGSHYVQTYLALDRKPTRGLEHRFDQAGVTSCSWLRPS